MNKQFSPSCENNKDPILQQLLSHFAAVKQVLEIGSGTGQHAAYFAAHLTHLQWHCTDIEENHPSINGWVSEAKLTNVTPPIPFFIGRDNWPLAVDAVFSANTTHIMQKSEAKLMMQLVAENLPSKGVFCQYGPFNVNGQYTSESNQSFDKHLLTQGCGGIRDIAELVDWADGLALRQRVAMPANNFLLVWEKTG